MNVDFRTDFYPLSPSTEHMSRRVHTGTVEHSRPPPTTTASPPTSTAAGRAGALSVPHLLSLNGDQLSSTPHPDLRRYATPIDIAGPLSSTDAYLISWSAPHSDELTLTKDQQTVVRLKTEPNRTLVISEQGQLTLPATSGPVAIVIDGPCIEICTSVGNVGLGQVVQPWQHLRIVGKAVECSALSR